MTHHLYLLEYKTQASHINLMLHMTLENIHHSLSYPEMLRFFCPCYKFVSNWLTSYLFHSSCLYEKTKTTRFSSQQNCHYGTRSSSPQAERWRDVQSPVQSSALQLWVKLWFNHSLSIGYYIKEIVLQQGSESKRIKSVQKSCWVTKEEATRDTLPLWLRAGPQ